MKHLRLVLLSLVALGAAAAIGFADEAKAKDACKACCEKKESCEKCCGDKCASCCGKEEKKCCADEAKCADGEKCEKCKDGAKCEEHAHKDGEKK